MAVKKEKKKSEHEGKLEERAGILHKLSIRGFLSQLEQDYFDYSRLNNKFDKSLKYNSNKTYYNQTRDELEKLGVDVSIFPERYIKFLETIKKNDN